MMRRRKRDTPTNPVHGSTKNRLPLADARTDRSMAMTQEEIRMSESASCKKYWKRSGPYLSERTCRTVREDYSAYGNAWEYLHHDHARSRTYRRHEASIA